MARSEAARLSPAARAELEDIYRRVDQEIASSGVCCWLRGQCCDFEANDHVLYASSAELAYVLEGHPEPFEPTGVECPFWVDGLCTERRRRPLGCRTYYCDERYREPLEAICEKYHGEVRELSERHGITYRYAPFVASLRDLEPRCASLEEASPGDTGQALEGSGS